MTDYNEEMYLCSDSLSLLSSQIKVLKSLSVCVCVCFSCISGEHLGADLPGVFSPGDDQHGSLHHYGKTFHFFISDIVCHSLCFVLSACSSTVILSV